MGASPNFSVGHHNRNLLWVRLPFAGPFGNSVIEHVFFIISSLGLRLILFVMLVLLRVTRQDFKLSNVYC